MIRGIFILLILAGLAYSAQYYVKTGAANGNGTIQEPFNHPQYALQAAMPGDSIFVFPGVFQLTAPLNTVRDGAASQPIALLALQGGQPPVFTGNGTVMKISHRHFVLKGIILDGQMGNDDVLKLNSGGSYARIIDCEIRYGLRDGIDLHRADNVLIENCHIHHFLAGSYTNQQDAHGIVATNQKHLTIRGCDIHHVSGDCFQTDPNRSQPLWDDVLLEDCRLWTGPLDADYGAWHAGEIPGENAVDTKICTDSLQYGYRPLIKLNHIEAYGFEPGYISNRAAFNIKEQVDCRMEAVTVHHSEIAFRLRGDTGRGSAHVIMMNCVAYENEKVFRVEDGVELLKIWNCTFDAGNGIYFKKVSGGYQSSGFELKNSLFVGNKPSEASHFSNLAVDLNQFADPAGGDYHLINGSLAINAGIDLAEVLTDMDEEPRPAGAYDAGADEYYSALPVSRTTTPLPAAIELVGAYPNPFNPVTHLQIRIKHLMPVRLEIFNILGQPVRSLWNGALPAGEHRFTWAGRDDAGNPLPAGIYFASLKSGRYIRCQKLVLAK